MTCTMHTNQLYSCSPKELLGQAGRDTHYLIGERERANLVVQPARFYVVVLYCISRFYAGHAVDRKSLQFHVIRACTNISRFAIYAFVLTGTSLFSVLQLAAFSVVGLLPLANNAVHSPTSVHCGGHYESHNTKQLTHICFNNGLCTWQRVAGYSIMKCCSSLIITNTQISL